MSFLDIEKRSQNRRKVYYGEGVKITLKDENEVHSFNGEAADVSPWGLAFIVLDQNLDTYPKLGDTVKVYYSNREKNLGYCCF